MVIAGLDVSGAYAIFEPCRHEPNLICNKDDSVSIPLAHHYNLHVVMKSAIDSASLRDALGEQPSQFDLCHCCTPVKREK